LTRELSFFPLAINFDSGDEIGLAIRSTHEHLDEAFEIRSGRMISPGSYDFLEFEIEATTAQRRNFWVSAEASTGSFFDGDRTDYGFASGYKVAAPLFAGIEFERSEVSLPAGDFDTNIIRGDVNLLFSPKMTLTNFFQFDSESRRIGWQSRFRWIVQPGNEILIVWNAAISENPSNRYEFNSSQSRAKIIYNYRL
jgi:hypothetical protein